MHFLSNKLCTISKPMVIVANGNGNGNGTLPQNSDSDQTKPQLPPLPRRNSRLRNGPPKPSIMQMERIVGAGTFRDVEPPLLRGSDMRKTVMDLFLGEAMESEVQKKMRQTGEWLATNAEPKIQSSRKGILMFMFQWMLPIWGILLLVAFGAIKLPFSNPFLDDILM